MFGLCWTLETLRLLSDEQAVAGTDGAFAQGEERFVGAGHEIVSTYIAIDGLHAEFVAVEGSDEPMFGFGIGYIFFISESVFARIAVVNGLQYVAHVVFVSHLVDVCVTKGKGFDDILYLWQQRRAVDLETLDFGDIHDGYMLLDMFPQKSVQFCDHPDGVITHSL